MLQPKRVKYRRPHGLSYEGLSKAGNEVSFGEYGLQATSGNYITNKQIEAARIVLARYTKRSGQIWIRIYPHLGKELCLKLLVSQKLMLLKHYA